MDSPLLPCLTRKEQILINRCRIFLQIECLSNITNSEGNRHQGVSLWLPCIYSSTSATV
jgi:hypothetical protein